MHVIKHGTACSRCKYHKKMSDINIPKFAGMERFRGDDVCLINPKMVFDPITGEFYIDIHENGYGYMRCFDINKGECIQFETIEGETY